MSVTPLSAPLVRLSVTVPPEAIRLFPLLSFSCTVIFEVLLPSAVIETGSAVIVDFVTSAVLTAKVAVTDLLAFIVTVLGLSVPLRSPLQPVKVQPASAVAVSSTAVPVA